MKAMHDDKVADDDGDSKERSEGKVGGVTEKCDVEVDIINATIENIYA